MAEDQHEEEEKFDFTGEGEAVNYISLEQARVLAMQAARENPGEYGGQYQTISMAFEVVQANEGEDYYDVTLSFRPQNDFSGRPGQEQFFIEKEGTVAHRQVLSVPRRRGSFPVLPVAIGVVIVGVIIAVAAVLALDGSGDSCGMTAVAAPTETPVSVVASIAPTDTLIPPTLLRVRLYPSPHPRLLLPLPRQITLGRMEPAGYLLTGAALNPILVQNVDLRR
jgi:hypothetical protein